MGVGYNFVCRDCKEYYTLGYGSYRTWIFAQTLKEFDERADKDEFKDWRKNQNLRWCLGKHQGHDYEVRNMDYTYEKDGKLMDENPSPYSSAPDAVVIEDMNLYKRIDMDGDFKEPV